jgi:DNA polymerase-1
LTLTALVDFDILMFKFACRHETKWPWPDETISIALDLEQACKDLDDFLIELQLHLGATDLLLCLTNERNFRYVVLPSYKHNRQDKEKPALWAELRQYGIDNYPSKEKKWMEADDVMGYLGSMDPEHYIICSTDKDMKTIPCTLFNWTKDQQPKRISVEEANDWFYMQTLMGDTTDGYPGCPGIGIKRAKELVFLWNQEWYTSKLSQEAYIWEQIVKTYQSASEKRCLKTYGVYPLTEEVALQQARVARILRFGEYDTDREEVKLWEPNRR